MNKFLQKSLSLALPSLLLVAQQAHAQLIEDGIKYAQNTVTGTARSIGFGGALGSVGGDFSTLSVNPAGIGMYRSSEFMVSPGLRFSGSKSTYTGSETGDNNVRFGFNNIGMVFTSAVTGKNYDKSDWKSASFGLGINRTADFSRTYNYEGTNNTSSGSQYFEGYALIDTASTVDKGNPGTPGFLGYQSYLLSGNYTSYVPYRKGLDQFKTVQEKGGTTEIAISGGGNYKDKLLIGATLGIPVLNHRYSSNFSEQTSKIGESDSFDNYSYNETVKTTGSGVNLKLGAIYKFNDYFRAGLAFHTPTIYSFTEISGNNITTTSNLYGTTSIVSPDNTFDYTIITPFKAIASATGMLGKHGFVSLDYEYINYSTMRYSFNADGNPGYKALQNSYNKDVKALFGSASNIRAGIELKFEQFFVRGGYGYYGSPYKNKAYQSSRDDFSFGLGYRFGKTFVDFALMNSYYKFTEKPYVLEGGMGYTQAPDAIIKNNLTSGVLTIGWKM